MFVYTREAHPGERVDAHHTFEDKLANAARLRDEIGIRRPILVDDLVGTGHLACGGLPNMTWLIGRGGRILYKADWTSAANVEAFAKRYRAERTGRPAGTARSPYLTEQVEFRQVDRERFYECLRTNGPRAYTEFTAAEQIWAARERGDTH
jgi:hypothetical protein